MYNREATQHESVSKLSHKLIAGTAKLANIQDAPYPLPPVCMHVL